MVTFPKGVPRAGLARARELPSKKHQASRAKEDEEMDLTRHDPRAGEFSVILRDVLNVVARAPNLVNFLVLLWVILSDMLLASVCDFSNSSVLNSRSLYSSEFGSLFPIICPPYTPNL